MERDGPDQHPYGYVGEVGPWFYATLMVPCSTCNAVPGERCSEAMHTVRETRRHGGVDVRVARRIRPRYHLARYERARDLAGVPIERTTKRGPTAAELRAMDVERARLSGILEDAARRIRSGSC